MPYIEYDIYPLYIYIYIYIYIYLSNQVYKILFQVSRDSSLELNYQFLNQCNIKYEI